MKHVKQWLRLSLLILVWGLVVTILPAADTAMPRGAYLDGGSSKVAVILCPGRGEQAESLVSHPLRKAIHRELGYHTLMLAMPQSLEMGWKEHIQNFPEAYRRIQAAVDFLRKGKQVETIYLMGHSMGSRMATGFIAEYPEAGVAGFIGVGIRAGGPRPLNSTKNLMQIDIPVVDIFGDGGDGKDARQAKFRAGMVSPRYTQVFIAGADHKFTHHRTAMVNAVLSWLRNQQKAD